MTVPPLPIGVTTIALDYINVIAADGFTRFLGKTQNISS
jgi:hypothetical protein